MELLKRIEQDFLTAYKAKETDVKNCLGMIKSDILIKQKEKSNLPLEEKEILSVLITSLKKREQTIEIIKNEISEKANELRDLTLREIDVIKTYLPQGMSEEEIKEELEKISGVLINSGFLKQPKDLLVGAMKHFNQNFKGAFDNNMLKKFIEVKIDELFKN